MSEFVPDSDVFVRGCDPLASGSVTPLQHEKQFPIISSLRTARGIRTSYSAVPIEINSSITIIARKERRGQSFLITLKMATYVVRFRI